MLVVNPKIPAKDVKELVAYLKTKAGTQSFASYSAGTLSHVMGLQLNKAAGLDMQHVGYKGIQPAMADVISGRVELSFASPIYVFPLLGGGKA